MEKILSDGTVLEKARFLRTTCKQCGKELPRHVIMREGKFCDKNCNRKYVSKQDRWKKFKKRK